MLIGLCTISDNADRIQHGFCISIFGKLVQHLFIYFFRFFNITKLEITIGEVTDGCFPDRSFCRTNQQKKTIFINPCTQCIIPDCLFDLRYCFFKLAHFKKPDSFIDHIRETQPSRDYSNKKE